MKKRIVYFLILFFGGSLLTYGYFAQFLFDVDRVYVTLGSTESTTIPIRLSFDRFIFNQTSGPASYRISRLTVCGEYDSNGDCIKNVPDLCPYLSLSPESPSPEKNGFGLNPFDTSPIATGEFDVPNIIADEWNLGIHSPCFEGECPVDYDAGKRGFPLPQSMKGQTFMCELDSWSNDPVYPVLDLSSKQLFANTPAPTVLVSAVLTGEPVQGPVQCCSSVAFIPGLQATRLATKISGSENILWEPNRNADVRKLYLDTMGNSVDPGVYSKGIIDTIRFGGTDVYQSFMDDMDALVSGGTIARWKPLSYDWRSSLGDIVDNGTLLEDGTTEFMIPEIEKLASSSKSGKVSIVTHSNGGLVAKALIQKLEASGKAGFIDKLIMVAAPQLGTPQAIPNMLHGTNIFGGFIMNRQTSRGLALNMPGAYQLLPSKEYFNVVASPVIAFDQSLQGFNNFISKFGNQITDYDTLKRFILDTTNNRTTNPDSAVENILTLNPTLIRNADTVHASIDNYTIPPTIEVSTIAGWGIDTVSGIEYYKKPSANCAQTVCTKTFILDYKPIFVEDGDKTVVVPSSTSADANTYYLNLEQSNNLSSVKFAHDNIFENQSIKNLISNLLHDSSSVPQFITTTKPLPDPNTIKYRISVHSPVSIGIRDSSGRYTGLISNTNQGFDLKLYDEQIPNSYYLEMGEGKYVGAPATFPVTIDLTGTGIGTFTLEIEQVKGGAVVNKSTHKDIPVMVGSKAQMKLVPSSPRDLRVDYNGDGINDSTLLPGQQFNSVEYLNALRLSVPGLKGTEVQKRNTIIKIDATIKMIKAGMILGHGQRIQEFLGSLQNNSAGSPPVSTLSLVIINDLIEYATKFKAIKL